MERAHTTRLFTTPTIPGWLVLIWQALDLAGRVDLIRRLSRAAWEAALSPRGHVIALILAVAWLTLVATWPSLKIRLYTASGRTPLSAPKPLPDRVTDIEKAVGVQGDKVSGLQGYLQRVDFATKLENYERRIYELEQRLPK